MSAEALEPSEILQHENVDGMRIRLTKEAMAYNPDYYAKFPALESNRERPTTIGKFSENASLNERIADGMTALINQTMKNQKAFEQVTRELNRELKFPRYPR